MHFKLLQFVTFEFLKLAILKIIFFRDVTLCFHLQGREAQKTCTASTCRLRHFETSGSSHQKQRPIPQGFNLKMKVSCFFDASGNVPKIRGSHPRALEFSVNI